MTKSQYLLRFDDICPTMNWAVWDAIESHLMRLDLRPILAVVPDNQDPKLMIDPPRADFWERVRAWQAKGWTIALHGDQHRYVNRNAGMLGLTPQSEFAGLPRAEQEAKLRRALGIFAEQGVRADAWVAPSHSFDRVTVEVLHSLGVNVISDGLWPWPFTDRGGTFWIPQQLWSFHPRPAGVWTVCSHPNGWTARAVEQFANTLEAYAGQITSVSAVRQAYAGRKRTLADRLRAWLDYLWVIRIKSPIWDLRRRMREKRQART